MNLATAPLVFVQDKFHRSMHDLRISVMDRCNLRCTYCMPVETYGEDYAFLRNDERLSFNEIERVCRAAAQLGVSKLRLTGGEPLLRGKLPELITRLRCIDGITDIAMTTNGILLPRHADALREAGLSRVTVSLDTLDAEQFQRISGGRGELSGVLEGIAAAQAAGFPQGVKINAVIQRGVNETAVMALAERYRGSGIVVRFIEYMDVGNRNHWTPQAVVPAAEILARLHARWPLHAVLPEHPGQVAQRFRFDDGQGEIGVIASISQPFCGDCARARLSSEGVFHTCLFASGGTDLRHRLREGMDEDALAQLLATLWRTRTDRYSEQRGAAQAHSERRKIEMHYIGG